MNEEMIVLSLQEISSVITTLKQIKPRGFKSMDRVVGLVLFFENKLSQRSTEQPIEVEDNCTN